jgi:hypothetical protein
MHTNPESICLEMGHLALASTSLMFLIMYTAIVLRMIRVGGSLDSVEFNIRRFEHDLTLSISV